MKGEENTLKTLQKTRKYDMSVKQEQAVWRISENNQNLFKIKISRQKQEIHQKDCKLRLMKPLRSRAKRQDQREREGEEKVGRGLVRWLSG